MKKLIIKCTDYILMTHPQHLGTDTDVQQTGSKGKYAMKLIYLIKKERTSFRCPLLTLQ